jgi:L-aminopeptidase/D-esterase-like protein
MNKSLTMIEGIKVGHAQNMEALTGCSVVLCEKGATAGVDQRGGAPGTRETDLLKSSRLVEKVHGIMLAGGSAFGLDAASGAMKYLEKQGSGFNVAVAKVPIVQSAVLFDLALGSASIRPDAEMGYQACLKANSDVPQQGNVGAGTGASVGKILSMGQAMKSGIGNAGMTLSGGIKVAVLIAVNAFGNIIDPDNGKIIAGVRSLRKGPVKIGNEGYFADSLKTMNSLPGRTILDLAQKGNTVIGVIATNAKLSKEECSKVAQMDMNGLAKCIRPANTMLDGDTLFSLATGKKKADVNLVGAMAAELCARAIINAVMHAEPLEKLPSAQSLTS